MIPTGASHLLKLVDHEFQDTCYTIMVKHILMFNLGKDEDSFAESETFKQAKIPLFTEMSLLQLFLMATTILRSLHFLIILYVSNIPLAFA